MDESESLEDFAPVVCVVDRGPVSDAKSKLNEDSGGRWGGGVETGDDGGGGCDGGMEKFLRRRLDRSS
jgi:hypothetical protein